MLSPWETPLKLSLYVIYTENKAWAKNHRECLFKHNSHGLWKMIKACSLIVNIHIFRMSSFKMELLHLMSTSQYNRRRFLTDYCKINLENKWNTWQEKDKKQCMLKCSLLLKERRISNWIIKCYIVLGKDGTSQMNTNSNIHGLKVDFWSLTKMLNTDSSVEFILDFKYF